MKFKNKNNGETVTHYEFIVFVWEEAEKHFEKEHPGQWCNLSKEEQIYIYCKQYEYQLKNHWKIIF